MSKGDYFPPEWRTFTDAQTGARIQQLTNYKGNSHHLYFTNPGWYDGGRKLLFGSDRQNATNLFGIELGTGQIQQLTHLDPPLEIGLLGTSKNPCREEVYFWHGARLVALDLETLEERTLYQIPPGFRTTNTNVTADGGFVCTSILEDLSDRLTLDLGHGYIGMEDHWAARPHSQVIRVGIHSGEVQAIHEEKYWIGHINTSPTQPHLLTFCHEGPWNKVDHRIWGLDINTGTSWKIRPRTGDERVGHEYWHADGEHIGYHGKTTEGAFVGSIRYDNTHQTEASITPGTTHCHSNDTHLIVGDGSRTHPQLLLWRFTGNTWEGPKVLHTHRGSFHVQVVHVHPRFTSDGGQVVFTSDHNGYGNIYLADIPNYDILPDHG